MNARERVKRVLEFQAVDRLPRDLWGNDPEILAKYPLDLIQPKYTYGIGQRCKGRPDKKGNYTDCWGCVWEVGEDGVCGEVKSAPFQDSWDSLNKYPLPWEVLEGADLSEVNRSCAESGKFMLPAWHCPNLFERMQFLRGTENLMIDLAYGVKEIYQLRDLLHEFFIRELEMWVKTDVDGIHLSDDWGSQTALLINPELWRAFFKPYYKAYADLAHRQGKYVFFHSDGFIEEIYPDLIEIGVNAVNSQLFCMNLEKLGELYAGKITFWGEIDRQHILHFGSVADVRAAVRRVAKALLKGKRTGVIAQCSWSKGDPKENIAAVFEEWDKI